MDDQGHVLTNHHVIAGSRTVSLVLSTGDRVTADVIGSNRENDIAVLRARSGDLPTARLGVSADLRIGQSVIAVGSPVGLTGTGPRLSAGPPVRSGRRRSGFRSSRSSEPEGSTLPGVGEGGEKHVQPHGSRSQPSRGGCLTRVLAGPPSSVTAAVVSRS